MSGRTPVYRHDESVQAVRCYFDSLGDREWDRLDADLASRVSFEVHLRFLRRYLQPGMRVLEVGAGPGRFTIAMARIGVRLVVTDLSPVQLELNAGHVRQAGHESAVESRQVLDICEVSQYGDGSFDAVVAYGGPLSYAFDQADDALRGLLRVTRPGGPVIASVMSTLGAFRYLLPSVLEVADAFGEDAVDRIFHSGDLRETQPPGSGQHTCRMFRLRDVRSLVASAGGTLLATSASNWASLGDPTALTRLAADRPRWERFVEREVAACAEPGAVDGGTHLLFAAAR